MKRTLSVLTLAALAVLGACEDGTEPEGSETLVLSFQGLDPLANGYHYEGWAILNGEAVTTGKFNVDAGGSLVTTTGSAIAGGEFDTGRDLSGASAIIITIEPAGDTDAIPAATHIVAGSVSAASATLSVGAPQALGNAFTSATGKYILATPTDGANTNENSGIWFLDLATGAPTVGLDLPVLPAGWEYEGWVVINGQPVTSGRFTSTTAVDFADPFSSTMPGPPFPGEDYLLNAPAGLTFPTDLAGGTAVISIEPQPDDSPSPFTLKPLTGAIPAAAVDHVTYDMVNNGVGSIQGTATIR